MKSGENSTGFGHGKVILLGEHAVVFGHTAVAAGIRTGVRAHASLGSGNISVPAWELEARVGDESLPGQAAKLLLEALHADPHDFDFWVEAEIPARAGLGSSAAMAVAIARAVAADTGATHDQIQSAIAAFEKVFHRTPSGIDAAAATRGCLGRFDRTNGWKDVTVAKPFELCVGITGKSHDTGALVAGVRQLCETVPVANRLIESMGGIATAGIDALAKGDLPTLGRLFDLAQGLLSAVGVSALEIDDMVYMARAAGALGAKLTGAGGGGAVIALAEEHGEEVLRRWRAKGYYGFTTWIA
jgi:mevalonate kinase